MHTNPGKRLAIYLIVLYGLPNAIAMAASWYFDITLVDLVPVAVTLNFVEQIQVGLAVALTMAGIYFLMTAGNRYCERCKDTSARPLLGTLIFLAQLVSLASLLLFDYGRVGAKDLSSNPLITLTSYLKSDFLFLLYYSQNRKLGISWPNFLLYVILNTLRGWSSIWLIIAVIEIYHQLEKKLKIKFKHMALGLVIVTIAYPAIYLAKNEARGTEAEFSFITPYISLANRLQLYTNTLLIFQESSAIRAAYDAKQISPWYANDPITSRLVGKGDNSTVLQKYISENYLIDYTSLGFYSDDLSWYTHVGIAGWIAILPWYSSIALVMYCVILMLIPYLIAAKIIRARGMLPLLHISSILYIFHGWLEVQVGFIAALLVYTALFRLSSPSTKTFSRSPTQIPQI